MSDASFDTAFAALTDIYDDTHDLVTADVSGGRFAIASPGFALTDLVGFVASVFGHDDAIPDWIPRGVRLTELELQRDPTTSEFSCSFTVAADDVDWVIIEGMAVTGASLAVEVGADGVRGVVGGSMRIEQVELAVEIEIPDQIMTTHVHTVSDEVGFLSGNGLLPPVGAGRHPSASPSLVDLSLYASIRDHRYVLHVEVADLLHVPPFDVDRVVIEASFGTSTDVTLWADFTIDLDNLGPVVISTTGHIGAPGWSFAGHALLSDAFTLGALADDLASLFGASAPHLPSVVGDVVITELSASLNTATDEASFDCRLAWPDDDVGVAIELRHSAGEFTARGTLAIGDLHFDLVFDHSGGHTALVGVFSAAGGVEVTLATVLEALGAGDGMMGRLASDFSFGLLDAVLAYESGSKMVFAADMDLGVDLSGLGSLPVVGSMLPAAESMRLTFRPVVSTAWTADELELINASLPSGVGPLPSPLAASPRLDAQLQLGDGAPIDLPMIGVAPDASTASSTGAAKPQAHSTASSTGAADSAPSEVQWHEVGRSFGPVRVSEVGIHYDATTRRVEVLLSGAISIAGLELSLVGLGARYGLDDQHLDVTLHGIGLDLHRDPIEIAGAFANVDGDFVGKVVVRTSEFAIAALGGFKMVSGSPSMFVYGVLDYPLGGPPFFFVDGLALGFGYNRRLIPPAVRDVRQFPLVVDAITTPSAPMTIDEQLTRLHAAVPPSVGDYWLAVGVKFTSFKLVESFVLLVVSVGEHVEIDILGTATYQTPPGDLGPIPPMARAELNLAGRIAPDDGTVLVQAQLTENSYVYNPFCHIYGGFAFASWFSGDHAGDFVLSVGGYHPAFVPPEHYPRPPRIGLKYQVTPHIYVKGEGYFALTPSLFMAGVALEASATIDAASATFRISADFLIGWEPYHYDALLQIDVSAKWHCFHTSAHIGLHIWGPDFAGVGEVRWTVFSFEVKFGASSSFGAIPIGFDRFRDGFLPAADKACSLRIAAGLIDSVDSPTGTVWNVNMKELRIETSSLIPEGAGLGIAPMHRTSLTGTEQTITVTRDGNPVGDFDVVALPAKTFPSALWGTSMKRTLHDQPVEAVAGHSIVPKRRVHRSNATPIARKDLDYDAPIALGARATSWTIGFHDPGDDDGGLDPHGARFAGLPWHRITMVTSAVGRIL